jgi:hypothetical protein
MRFSRTSAVATAVLLAAGGMSTVPAAASDASPTARASRSAASVTTPTGLA